MPARKPRKPTGDEVKIKARARAAARRIKDTQKPKGYRRHTPLSELPVQRLDAEGNVVCRHCGGKLSGRRTAWCSDSCRVDWEVRSSPSQARFHVEKRDHGVCKACGVNTRERDRRVKAALKAAVQSTLAECLHSPARARKAIVAFTEGQTLALFGLKNKSDLGWQMDHIVPVEHGGGECGLENLQTLCNPCHKKKTAQQAKARARRKRNANAKPKQSQPSARSRPR